MILTSSNDLSSLISFINLNDILAIDIETTGLNTRKDYIIGIGISNLTTSYYLCHLEYDTVTKSLKQHLLKEEIERVLNLLTSKKLITFNGSFDTRFILNYFSVDLTKSIWCDAMLAKHTVDEERPFGLKDIAKKLYGLDSVNEQKEMKASISQNGGSATEYYKASLVTMAQYCMADCKLTYKIAMHYLDKIEQEGLSSFFFKDEVMPLYIEVTIPMEMRGVPVDLELLESSKINIEDDIDILEEQIQNAIHPLLDEFKEKFLWTKYPPRRGGDFAQAICRYAKLDLPETATGKFSITQKNIEKLSDSPYKSFLLGGAYLDKKVVQDIQMSMHTSKYLFNISSKHHLKALFFTKLQETPVSRTDKGSPQCNDDFLKVMADKYDWCKLIQDYNKLNKLNGSYISRILELQENGIYYPSFFQHRTISGRYGSDIQQLPKPKKNGSEVVLKYNNIIRKLFISGKDYKFIDADYESLEPHVFSHVSSDPGLINIFKEGKDFYSTIAIDTEKLDKYSPIKSDKNYLGSNNPELRQKAKAYSLGIPYGMGAYALGKTLNISEKEAKKLIDQYLTSYPELKKWMDRSFNDCVGKGYVKSEAGRVRHMPKAPVIWKAHSDYILDPLKLWERFNENELKYKQMKYLRSEMVNYINNSRNFQIQSLAASITNRACIAINRELNRQNIDGYVCAQIHDQIIVKCEKNKAEKVRSMVEFIMENCYKLSLKLKAPASIAENFLEGH
jgi:DNA polymerase I-like protein with 3'-5' exonuclease and polymerase domains